MRSIPAEALRRAFVTAFALPPQYDVDRLRRGHTESWDSIGHMELVLELERAFEVTLAPEEVFALDSFQRAREILARHEIHVDP